MKTTNDRESHHLAITSEDLKERVETDAVLSVGFIVLLALCVGMSAGLYSWSRHAPVFRPAPGAPAIEQTIPWQG